MATKIQRGVWAVATTAFLVSAGVGRADEMPPSVSPGTLAQGTSAEAKPERKGRIPSGWGRLNLEPTQKEAIYQRQAEAAKQLARNEAEMEQMRARLKTLRDEAESIRAQLKVDLETILTGQQRTDLRSTPPNEKKPEGVTQASAAAGE